MYTERSHVYRKLGKRKRTGPGKVIQKRSEKTLSLHVRLTRKVSLTQGKPIKTEKIGFLNNEFSTNITRQAKKKGNMDYST